MYQGSSPNGRVSLTPLRVLSLALPRRRRRYLCLFILLYPAILAQTLGSTTTTRGTERARCNFRSVASHLAPRLSSYLASIPLHDICGSQLIPFSSFYRGNSRIDRLCFNADQFRRRLRVFKPGEPNLRALTS